MVYDKIDNYALYAGISEGIRLGLEFLSKADAGLECGVHEISPSVKAIVSEYESKAVNENGYEAHRAYIDIQYLLSGKETICSLPLEYLKETKPYSAEKDAAFYEECGVVGQRMTVGNGYFAIYFPQDGHMPGLSLNGAEKVKKVVVKVIVG